MNWFQRFWYHDTIDEIQRKMLWSLPHRLQTHDYWLVLRGLL